MAVNLLHKLPKTYSINGIQYYTITGEKVKGNKTVKNCHALKSQVNDVKNLTKSNNRQINNMSHSKGLNDVNRTNEANISNKHSIFLWLFLAIVLVTLLGSCGSRKVAKSETKESETNVESNSIKVQNNVTDNTKVMDTSTSDEIEISPISDTLPMVVNGVTYKNVKIRHSKKKNNISINKDIKVQYNVQKSGLKTVKTNKVVNEKQIERKQSYLWLWWLLLLIPIYYAYQKYKGLLF